MASPRLLPRVLVISGSDSGGGAGLQADIKACLANGAFAMNAVSCITAQNTQGVQGVLGIEPSFVVAQMDSVLDDLGADSAKTGMLATAEVVRAVSERLQKAAPLAVVVDPVMVTASGYVLVDHETIQAVCSHLLPIATVCTPNLREAALLLGLSELPETLEAVRNAAKAIFDQFGPNLVLVKGSRATPSPDAVWIFGATGDSEATIVDVLYDGVTWTELACPAVETRNTHGTGCTLASAIAAHLARGKDVNAAVVSAKEYLDAALRASATLALGSGSHGPIDHGFNIKCP
ncbi:phosphomethylpyrimidine kinase [Pelagophyceae sp. CCMP2097]|nr:phosphomethylpyrimidine kinase [Pelagophyceae sp. CCMP2097]